MASKSPSVETEVPSVTDQGPVMVLLVAALRSMQPRITQTHSPVSPLSPWECLPASLVVPGVLALTSREVHHSVNPVP